MKTEKQKMLDGELYNADDPELRRERMNARRLTRIFNDSLETDSKKRTRLLKELFGSTGEHVYVEPTFRCDYGYNIHVGENFFANFDCVFLDVHEIRIGITVLLHQEFIFILRLTRSMHIQEYQERNTEFQS